jgi:transposase
MFADEARFGRINRPRPCWAPIGIRPEVASQLIREYIYLYGAVSPKDGTCIYLIMPTSNTACFQAFLNLVARKFAGQDILLVLDGAPNHRCGDLVLPDNISLLFLPPYAPELNPKENLWDEIREKIFKNYALKSIDAVRDKLKEAILYMERKPEIVKSITSFPYVLKSLMWKWYYVDCPCRAGRVRARINPRPHGRRPRPRQGERCPAWPQAHPHPSPAARGDQAPQGR